MGSPINRVVTGVTWIDSELRHNTREGDERDFEAS